MLKLVFGAIGGLLGAAIVICFLLAGGPHGEGANFAGQMAALVIGVFLFGAGAYALLDGLKNQPPAEPEKKPQRKEDEDDERTRRRRRSHTIDDDDLYGRSSKMR